MTGYSEVDLRSPEAGIEQVREHIGEDTFAQVATALYQMTVIRDRRLEIEETDAAPLDIGGILEHLDQATTVGLDGRLRDTEDVLRAIDRECAIRRHNESEFSDQGGRPSKVDRVVSQIDRAQRLYLLNEYVDQEFVRNKAVESLRTADPSRPTYYKIRDKIAAHDDLPYAADDVDTWRETAGVAKPQPSPDE